MSQLRNALRHGQFDLQFQPVVCPAEQRVQCFEALARFQPEAFAMPSSLDSDSIMALIERQGLSVELDYALIDKALLALVRMNANGSARINLSINLSVKTLSDRRFPDTLLAQVARYNIEPERVQFEIAESDLMSDQAYREVIPTLAGRGFTFAVDDFISDYANFNVLSAPQLSVVKVHSTVIQSIRHSDIARRFLCGLLTLAKSLNKQLVVEGVDSAAHYQFLESVGYDQFQGLYFGPWLAEEGLGPFVVKFEQAVFPTLFESFYDGPGLIH